MVYCLFLLRQSNEIHDEVLLLNLAQYIDGL